MIFLLARSRRPAVVLIMIRRRRRRHRKVRIPLWVHGAICAVLASAYWTIPPIPRASRSPVHPEVAAGGEPAPVRAAAAARGNGRPAYRHSVIPGGAYSVAEVERARRGDPVVDAHYAVFDAARLRMTQAPAPRSVYVSYRIGSDVYWTRHRVVLAAGEALITDGGHVARARCGNRVADTPQQPVAADDPPAADLDAPELPVPPETDWELPSALVVDLFPSVPLSRMAQTALAKPGGPSSSQSASIAGVGMGLGTGAGLLAPPVSGSTVPPVNGGIDRPLGPGRFVPAPWPGPPATGWYLPLPGPIGNALLLPSPWLPSTPAPNEGLGPTAPAGLNPIAGPWGSIPLPGTWSFATPPIVLPGPPGADPGPPTTGGTPGAVLPPPPIAVLPPSDPPVEPLPEPGTAMLVAGGVALVVVSWIRRRHGTSAPAGSLKITTIHK